MLSHALRSVPKSYYTLTYVTNLVNTTSSTSYTFTSASIGTAAAGRRIIIAAAFRLNTITSVTVGGQSCTQIYSTSANAIFISPVIATGTTANIVVSLGTAAACMGIGIYTINGTGNYSVTNNINYEVVASGLNSTTNTTTITVPNYNIGNALLWNTRGRSAHAGTWSFSGTIPMTENYDVTVLAGDTGMTAGSNNASNNYVNGTITHTTSGAATYNDNYALVRFY